MQHNRDEHIIDRTRMLDCLWGYQRAHGYIRDEDVAECSRNLGISQVEVEGVLSFYHFFHRKPAGKFTIYLNNSIVAEHKGFHRVREAFERETGATFGKTDPAGQFGLYETACIGLSDQEPAALINFYPFTSLNTLKVRNIIARLKQGASARSLSDDVPDNIRHTLGPDKAIFLRDYHPGAALAKLPQFSPEDVIAEVKKSQLSGMGGAFFPTGMKWEFCRSQQATPKYIVCNADEGEPGTFKDRILMHKLPGLMLEGMIIAGYAVGASEGIIYLRAEYTWLLPKLQRTIEQFKNMHLLGRNAAGVKGFNFKIRIQLGAGAYVCGEETALLNSLEGKRGEPRTKQYFPTEKGYLGQPTIVNNVETFCGAARVIEIGADHFLQTGTPSSPGTKLLSISGDCHLPGIYEFEWGTPISAILKACQASEPYFIQVSGPSGECISMQETSRTIARDDLRCGGSFMIFNTQRDVLAILTNFTQFFKHESCGLCTPCRAGNFILQRKLGKIGLNLADTSDFQEIQQWGAVMQATSRCGLGRAAPNALLMALKKFPEYFNERVDFRKEGLNKEFDMQRATTEYEKFHS